MKLVWIIIKVIIEIMIGKATAVMSLSVKFKEDNEIQIIKVLKLKLIIKKFLHPPLKHIKHQTNRINNNTNR